jgi:hypothetical protein
VPSFAIVENANGSVTHYCAPAGAAPWTSWPITIGDDGVFNVLSFGAVPDGVFDCSTIINTAISTAAAYSSPTGESGVPAVGGKVYLPPGIYSITKPILLMSNVEIFGASADSTTIFAASSMEDPSGNATAVMITNSEYFKQNPAAQSNMVVRDLTLNGNAPGNASAFNVNPGDNYGASIAFYFATDMILEGCRIFSCPNRAITVDHVYNPNNTVRGNIQILNNIIDILPLRDPTTAAPTRGNINIRLYSLNGVRIRGNVIGFNTPNNLADYTQTWSNDGIDTPGCSDVSITNNMVNFVVDGIGMSVGNDCLATDNLIYNFVGYGIRTFNGMEGAVANNQVVIASNVVISSLYDADFGSLTPGQAGIHVDQGTQGGTVAQQYAVTGNVVVGPFVSAGIELMASNGSCSGNSIDINHYKGSVNEAGPVPWILSAWRRKVHQWPESIDHTRWSSGLRLSNLRDPVAVSTIWHRSSNLLHKRFGTGSSAPILIQVEEQTV